MNFDSNMHITIDFSHWFFNAGGNSEPNDDLSMYIENDTDSQLIWSTNTNTEEWQNVVIDSVETLFDTENPFRISFITSDIEGSGHILEAGIDNIIITGQNTSNTASDILTDGDIRIYPNPTTNILNVDISHLNQSSYTYKVIDALGREVLLGTSPHSTFNIDTKTLKRGVYVLQINSFQSIRFIRN